MRVFISYSREDSDFSERLRDHIRALSYETWRDVDNIRQGEHWDDAIDRGLNRSDVVVGILSPSSVASGSVKNEWAWALANERPLMLLFYRPCAIPHRYVRINYLDFTQNEAEAFDQLGEALKNPARVVTTQDFPLPAGIAVSPRVGHDVNGTLNVEGDDIVFDQRTMLVDALLHESSLEQRNRRILLEKVHTFWIKGVLEHSLHGAALIALGMQEDPNAVDHPWGLVMRTLNWETELLPAGTHIIDLFEQLGRSLLILGEPGSGKTTMLLELARDAIELAESEPQEPIPVVLNLSSWCEATPTIANWVVGELNDKYLVPQEIGKALVKNENLLLLLDGLDEVRSELRIACVDAINQFRRDHGLTSIVVCSRSKDYQTLSKQLKLEGAVVLQPLTGNQIDDYLQGAGPKLATLRNVLKDDAVLQEMAQSPLILSIMTLAYSDAAIDGLSSLTSLEARRTHLFNAYIDRMFARRPVDQRYSSEDTIRWLAWLASQMRGRSQMVFLIEGLQPSWLGTTQERLRYLVGTRIVGGVATAVVLSALALTGETLLGTWIGVMTQNGSVGFGAGLGLVAAFILAICGLIVGVLIVGSTTKRDVKLVESVIWSWPGALRGFLAGTAGGLTGALLSILIVPILSEGHLDPIFVFLTGLVSGLCFGISFTLIGGMSGRGIGETTVPNEGIRQSTRTGLIVATSTGLVVALFTTLAISVTYFLVGTPDPSISKTYLIPVALAAMVGLGAGIVVSSISGLLFGVRSLLQHVTLRLIWLRSGHIPRNYADFLDYAVDHVFMRRVGGGYIFVHRLLLEHFASLDKP